MTMEVSPNSRDGISTGSSSTPTTTTGTVNASTSSLQLSVEQWELLRRLRNSHLSKTQIIRAYDELDRLDRELGNLFNSAPATSIVSSNQSIDPVSPTAIISSPLSNNNANQNNKRSHGHTINGFSVNRPSNGYHSSSSSVSVSSSHMHHSTSNINLRSARGSLHDINSSITNQHDTINTIDIEEETRELQELLAKGDAAIHNEISVFVYRYDLKQSQIARMAAVNQAYVSKFLRGDLFDLSENGRMAICRWYLRYKKIVQCVGGSQSSAELMATLTGACEPPTKMPRLLESQSNTNTSPVAFDTPKRTRFTFRPEHLDILEKAFLDNPYPDPRRREDIARICNEARTRLDNGNEVLSERDRVTDAIVTHWFQNKRKMTKSQRASLQEDSISLNNNGNHPSTLTSNDYENINTDDDIHIHHHPHQLHSSHHHHHHHHHLPSRKTSLSTGDIDGLDASTMSLEPQLAAYRAIMSRMVPFSNHNNERHSPKRFVKQEPVLTQDDPSHEDDSNSHSPSNEQHLSS